jgi:hypothetical protein
VIGHASGRTLAAMIRREEPAAMTGSAQAGRRRVRGEDPGCRAVQGPRAARPGIRAAAPQVGGVAHSDLGTELIQAWALSPLRGDSAGDGPSPRRAQASSTLAPVRPPGRRTSPWCWSHFPATSRRLIETTRCPTGRQPRPPCHAFANPHVGSVIRLMVDFEPACQPRATVVPRVGRFPVGDEGSA